MPDLEPTLGTRMPELYAADQVTVEWVPDVGPSGNNACIARPRDEDSPATVSDIPNSTR